MSTDSLAEEARNRSMTAIEDPLERQAIELLDRAGWTRGELAMCFEVSANAIGRIVDEVRDESDREAPECEARGCVADRRLEAVVFEEIGVERVYCPTHRQGVATELCGASAREDGL